jgi:hypothetical protein
MITCVTTSKNGLDTSVAEFRGKKLTAKSRHGSEFALCRQLIDLGCPDGELIVTNPAGTELMRFTSIHKAAQSTIKEGREGERLAKFTAGAIPNHEERIEGQMARQVASDALDVPVNEPTPVPARAA